MSPFIQRVFNSLYKQKERPIRSVKRCCSNCSLLQWPLKKHTFIFSCVIHDDLFSNDVCYKGEDQFHIVPSWFSNYLHSTVKWEIFIEGSIYDFWKLGKKNTKEFNISTDLDMSTPTRSFFTCSSATGKSFPENPPPMSSTLIGEPKSFWKKWYF